MRRMLLAVACGLTVWAIARPDSRGLAARMPAQIQGTGVFTASTQGVLVDVLVTDRGHPYAGLAASDFELKDNGVVQQIDVLRVSDLPLSVVLALDTSASTAGSRLDDLKAASLALLDGLHGSDRAALTTFGQAVAIPVPLTSDLSVVRRRINLLIGVGDTALFDGAHTALASTLRETGRSLVVVCTDGRDTSSWLDPEDVLESAKRTNAVVYVVATGGARRWGVLKELADTTGGQLMELASSGDLRPQFQRILEEFRSRYVLTYSPAGVAPGGFHRLDVRVRRGGLTVKARSGYLGGLR